jgi:DNA primase
MPVLPKRILDDIRSRNDIVDVVGAVVRLTKAGSAFKGLCPFHQEKTPSFQVNPARQIFHCFGCGAGGDVFAFLMKREGLDFMGAVRQLAQKANIPLEFEDGPGGGAERAQREKLYAIHAELAKEYHRILLSDPRADAARRYLAGRELVGETVKDFQIGYAPDGWDFVTGWAKKAGVAEELLLLAGLTARAEPRPGMPERMYDRFRDRVMFPICDEQGRVVAFSGRIMKPDAKAAKYVNSPETPIFRKSAILFALHRARARIVEVRTAIVCEGQIDVIRCHSAGFTNAVASQGTAFTENHARIIRRFADRVILVFDPDAAGQNAGLKTGLLFTEAGLDVRVARLPEGKDPDLLIKEKGKEGFEAVLAEARQVLDFYVEVHSAREDVRNPSGLRRVEMAAFELIKRMPDLAERESLLQRLAQRLAVNPQAVQRDFDNFDARERARQSRPEEPLPKEPEQAAIKPPPPEEELLLEHLAADPGLIHLAEAYAPPVLFHHDWSRQMLAAMTEARRNAGDWRDVLTANTGRHEGVMTWAAAVQMAPSKAGRQEFSREDAVKALILRLWVRHLKARKTDLQRQAASGGDVDPRFYQLTGDIKALNQWDEGLAIIEAHLEDLAQ